MSQELERVYTINLGKVLLSPDNRRSKRAINMIREFARHHMKTEDVKIDEELAHQIWKRGIRHPPRKIRVRMTKTDEGFVLISPYEEEEEELETKVEPKEEPKKATAKEELVEKPKLADFVDQKKDPQHYIDRYNKEKKYKAWFDKNYPNLTIEEAVGLKPTKTKEKPKKALAKKEKPKKASAKKEKPKKAPAKKEKPKKTSAKKEKPKKKSD